MLIVPTGIVLEWCSFSEPLKNWKIKVGGVPGKWCERCCETAKRRQREKTDEVKEDDKARTRNNDRSCKAKPVKVSPLVESEIASAE